MAYKQGMTQLEFLEHDYQSMLDKGKDPSSFMMVQLRDQIEGMKRYEKHQKILKEEGYDRYIAVVGQGPNVGRNAGK